MFAEYKSIAIGALVVAVLAGAGLWIKQGRVDAVNADRAKANLLTVQQQFEGQERTNKVNADAKGREVKALTTNSRDSEARTKATATAQAALENIVADNVERRASIPYSRGMTGKSKPLPVPSIGEEDRANTTPSACGDISPAVVIWMRQRHAQRSGAGSSSNNDQSGLPSHDADAPDTSRDIERPTTGEAVG